MPESVAAYGASLGMTLPWKETPWSTAFMGGLAFTPRRELSVAGQAAEFGWWAASAAACALSTLFEPVRLGPCGGFEVGRLTASGRRVETWVTSTAWWLASRLDARVDWQATERFRPFLTGGVVFPLGTQRFYFEPDVEAYASPTLAARAQVGLEFALP